MLSYNVKRTFRKLRLCQQKQRRSKNNFYCKNNLFKGFVIIRNMSLISRNVFRALVQVSFAGQVVFPSETCSECFVTTVRFIVFFEFSRIKRAIYCVLWYTCYVVFSVTSFWCISFKQESMSTYLTWSSYGRTTLENNMYDYNNMLIEVFIGLAHPILFKTMKE